MWKRIAIWTLKNRLVILIVLALSTAIMGYFASKVQINYEYTTAIPQSSPKLQTYKAFKKMFGEDGNLVVLGFDNAPIANPAFFTDFKTFCADLKQINGVVNTLSVPTALNIKKVVNGEEEKLEAYNVFENTNNADSLKRSLNAFFNLPFYKNVLYQDNGATQLVALRIDREVMNSGKRVALMSKITIAAEAFATKHKLQMHYSGLPYIRSSMAVSIQKEMNLFLLVSLLLTAVILFMFFRNINAVLFSLVVVLVGVIWAMGIMQLFGYKISLLTALVPPLIVVIGIPNCIYFLNKYHQEYGKSPNQAKALVLMVQRMGIVTLFTNITAAIGFGVFCFTSSALLKEFGWVSSLGIIAVFFISLFALPAIFSYLPAPNHKHTNYLQNKTLQGLLNFFERTVFTKRIVLYAIWGGILLISIIGMLRLNSRAFMVDDLPKSDKLYTDLKFFEKNFKGVMPLEIWIDTKRKNGATSLGTFNKIDELSAAINEMPNMGRPLSMVEAIKYVRQAYYDGDSTSYALPNSLDIAFIMPLLKSKGDTNKTNQLNSIVKSYVDSTKQHARISVNIADIGSKELPKVLKTINEKAVEIFDTNRYKINYTGTSVIFLEGSKFIINSLRDSLIYAFLMIFACMFFLFRNWRVVLISIAANVIPLVITAGIMGWLNIPLKPSTVLVFSVALGITIDVTIRFLINFKQELPRYNNDIRAAVRATIHDTGLSIIYTSLILIVGFLVFVISHFQGTQALGYLISLTLLLALFVNLTLLPALLVWMDKIMLKKAAQDPLWEVMNEEEDIDLDKLSL
jgi:uncharacterized protein